MPALSPFGAQLRAHRAQRGWSQLDLALEADTTPRYVSFIETGRSRPGRQLVMRLAKTLELTLRDANELLVAAGLSPAYPERDLDEQAMAPVRRVIHQLLENHEPYPAMVLGPGFRILQLNDAADRLFPGICDLSIEDIVARWFREPFDPDATDRPVHTPTIHFGDTAVRTITTVLRFDKAVDITTSELVVELMFPADADAETFFRAATP